jgi:transcriptional pleiotropic regulator of transition state genes
MKATGIVRRIDDLGQVVIPKEVRNKFLLCEGDPLEIFVEEDGIKLKKYVPDYNFTEMITDLERRFTLVTDIIGHKNTKEIQQKFKEIKELWVDTNSEV